MTQLGVEPENSQRLVVGVAEQLPEIHFEHPPEGDGISQSDSTSAASRDPTVGHDHPSSPARSS
jgi:hypothetical protein